MIFYRNPRIVVGTLPYWENEILLCKRSIEPRSGFWTLPSGYLENGETVEQGALRETLEEAGARVSIIRLFSIFSLPHVNQVYMIFLSDLDDLDFEPGEETLEVRMFRKEQVPWRRIAFRAIEFSLQRYFAQAEASGQKVHIGAYAGKKRTSWIRAEE
jgi:ADP-ribose pyrophosphatase YjhB (NUDIX family)